MKILFILNQLPYPPRNGVTIPSFNYMSGLSRHADVSLLFLRDQSHEWSDDQIEENKKLVKNLWVLDIPKKPVMGRIFEELKGKSFFHIGRKYDVEWIQNLFSENSFDAVWVTDDSILDVVVCMNNLQEYVVVAGLNDCITAVFKQSRYQIFLKGEKFKDRIRFLVKWIRSFRASKIENSILRNYSLIMVQSDSDRKYLEKISDFALADKIMVSPNGVYAGLFDNVYDVSSKELLFVGSLRGYSRIVEWLLIDVWPSIKRAHPDAVFHVIGKGASESLKSMIRSKDGVVHTEYMAEICDVYRNKAISLSPVFKDYGLINKVVESMAAGVPVVADKGSFGCVPGFGDGVHGFVANDTETMIGTINKLLDSPDLRRATSENARILASKHFNWDDRVSNVYDRMSCMVNN